MQEFKIIIFENVVIRPGGKVSVLMMNRDSSFMVSSKNFK